MTSIRTLFVAAAALGLVATAALAGSAERARRPVEPSVFSLAAGIGRPATIPAIASPRLPEGREPADMVAPTGG
jgi:hypothetical protein